MKDWLLSELRSMAAPSEAARFALDLSNQQVTLIERTMRGVRERDVATYGARDFQERIAAMRRRVSRRRRSAPRVDIVIPPELTLFRLETFPAEARGALRDEAWWRMDRMTPYRPETVCYDVALVGVEPNTGFLSVAVAVAPRDIVEEAVAYAKSWGFAPQRVTAAPAEGFPHGPLFVQASNERLETRSLRQASMWLTAAALIFACVGVWRGALERRDLAVALEATQAEAEAAVADAEAVRDRTLDLAQRSLRPTELRRSSRTAIEWLDALAAALPPNSIAERIRFTDGAVRVEGLTENSEAILSALEGSGAFTQVRFAEPLRAVRGDRRRRFVIEAWLAGREPEA